MLSNTESSPGALREDPRRAKSRARVLASAVELLREEGLSGLTIEAVAARSGVAKTTIYRQFADRDELHLSAVHSVGRQVPLDEPQRQRCGRHEDRHHRVDRPQSG